MIDLMNDTKRRLVVMVSEEAHAALHLEKGKRMVDLGQIIDSLVEIGIPESLEEVRRRRAAQKKGGKAT